MVEVVVAALCCFFGLWWLALLNATLEGWATRLRLWKLRRRAVRIDARLTKRINEMKRSL
jgi:hypothetical protein